MIATKNFKPIGYNSVSPYFVVDDAEGFIALLKNIFIAKSLRRYNRLDGSIMHAELQIDDSVIMLGSSNDQFKSNNLLIHIYVPDVDLTFNRAIDAGCVSIKEPMSNKEEPDKRGTFKDFTGNVWSVSTQLINP